MKKFVEWRHVIFHFSTPFTHGIHIIANERTFVNRKNTKYLNDEYVIADDGQRTLKKSSAIAEDFLRFIRHRYLAVDNL